MQGLQEGGADLRGDLHAALPDQALLHPACRGRKKAALTYVATYTLGCLTKHWNVFGVLLVGRLFCGVATSLLYSAFESWLVAEHFKVRALAHGFMHALAVPYAMQFLPCKFSARPAGDLAHCHVAPGKCAPALLQHVASTAVHCLAEEPVSHGISILLPAQRGYDGEWLGGVFSRAVFVGNGLVAILAGLVAHSLVETLALGPVAPFDAVSLFWLPPRRWKHPCPCACLAPCCRAAWRRSRSAPSRPSTR
jgi:hypothetical protein